MYSFPILLLVFKSDNSLAPVYLYRLLVPVEYKLSLSLNSLNLLKVSKTALVWRLPCMHVRLVKWNKLAFEIKYYESLSVF